MGREYLNELKFLVEFRGSQKIFISFLFNKRIL
nr:MAG TPA: hypothetical protein [Caudoviricetes sp.]